MNAVVGSGEGAVSRKIEIVGGKGEESRDMLCGRREKINIGMMVNIVKCYASRTGSARCLYVVDYVRAQWKWNAGIVKAQATCANSIKIQRQHSSLLKLGGDIVKIILYVTCIENKTKGWDPWIYHGSNFPIKG